MSAPDSPAVARVRTWLAAFELLNIDDVDRAGDGNVLTASDVAEVLAELDEARDVVEHRGAYISELLTEVGELRQELAALPEWRCPSCGATTRARMADRGAS